MNLISLKLVLPISVLHVLNELLAEVRYHVSVRRGGHSHFSKGIPRNWFARDSVADS